MKIVVDTSTIIDSLRSPSGASAELLRLALLGRVEMLVSVPLFIEYEAVATREEHLRAAGLIRQEVDALLDALAVVVRPIEIKYLWRPQLRDPDDEMVLEAAINGGAEAIVTFNVRDFADISAFFAITPMTPGEALARLSKLDS